MCYYNLLLQSLSSTVIIIRGQRLESHKDTTTRLATPALLAASPRQMACDKTVAETIETLTERLQTSTLLDDRRDACRGLRSLAKDYRVEVCAQAMDALLQSIKIDRHDIEIVNYCLDSLNYIISGSLADSPAATWPETDTDQAPTPMAEIFLKKAENVTTILDTIIDNDFKTRWVAVRLLCGLTRQKLAMVQDSILSFPLGVSRLIQLITEEQELIRNDALVLFVRLTQSNLNIQNLFAFENCFDKVVYIIELEGYLDGTVAVVMDCLNIILNLMQYNESNQILFREAGHIQKLMPFFNSIQTVQWTNERTACLTLVLQVIDSMIVPTNSSIHVQACQSIMQRCGLLDKLCELLTATSMPIGVLTETMNTASDIVRGHLGPNANMIMHTSAMMPVLLLSMVKEMCQSQERRISDQEKRMSELYNYMNVLHSFVSNSCAKSN